MLNLDQTTAMSNQIVTSILTSSGLVQYAGVLPVDVLNNLADLTCAHLTAAYSTGASDAVNGVSL